HRAVPAARRSRLAQVGAVAGRRVHRVDGTVKGQFQMSVTRVNTNDAGNGGLLGMLRRTYAMLAKEFIQLKRDRVSFAMIVAIPGGFERAGRRGDKPALLVAADATDPVAASSALASLGPIIETALAHDRVAGDPANPPFEIRAHARYNPGASSSLNIVPGLTG